LSENDACSMRELADGVVVRDKTATGKSALELIQAERVWNFGDVELE
jgi:hypothetical protein